MNRVKIQIMIVIKNLSVKELGEPLFEKVNLVIRPNERIAVVGSTAEIVDTFLRVLAGEIEMDEGSIKVVGGTLLYLSPETLNAEGYSEIFHKRPTFLLINTSSQTLRADATETLLRLIQNFRGGILISDQDEALARATKTTKVLEINSSTKTVTAYTGTYDSYILDKEKRDIQIREAYEKQQREKRRLETWLEQKRKEAAISRSPEKGATIRTKAKYLQREILDKEIPNPNPE
jgi:ATPase subunit of ABC transporter with duplicated ATPase domains